MAKSLLRTSLVALVAGLFARPVFAIETGLGAAAGPSGLNSVGSDIPTLIGKILGSVLGFTGTIFFILVIIAGLMWMTSGGNEERVKKAKQILIAAIIGLVIILSAYAITNFIGTAFGG